MTTLAPEAPPELVAEFAALEALAVRHRREYIRLRAIEMAKLTGQPVRFSRDRMTREQLEALPPVLDSEGTVLEPGTRVKCPDGVKARVVRVDKRSKRCVVDRADGQRKMTVARKLTVTGRRRTQQPDAAATAA
jgi:hypothetical protein